MVFAYLYDRIRRDLDEDKRTRLDEILRMPDAKEKRDAYLVSTFENMGLEVV